MSRVDCRLGLVSGGVGGLLLSEELLRVLPNLGSMRPEGEPETYEVREEENAGAEVHEVLDRLLVERVAGRIRVRVVT